MPGRELASFPNPQKMPRSQKRQEPRLELRAWSHESTTMEDDADGLDVGVTARTCEQQHALQPNTTYPLIAPNRPSSGSPMDKTWQHATDPVEEVAIPAPIMLV
ncbi:hypothetical protein S40285_09830 [Stachybotrys chlorohalonatus IBT 40285]|uniref:Uncharacterized protein n=1 Tax=Stachybotrys chlorohalonatus (strain IBT 40285) TaxID=1283841 RepID=A0A084QU73_STAC4|nr:hypothetical protein S40285_09830 [Stachybotrys chlorohalonata IBT 40285]